MQIQIDLATKRPGYKEALDAFIERNKVHGTLVEWGNPPMGAYNTPDRKLWRMSQVNPGQVCAELVEPEFDASTGIFTFQVAPYGPRRDMFEKYVKEQKELALNSRMTVDGMNEVVELLQYSLVPIAEQDDMVLQSTRKVKKSNK